MNSFPRWLQVLGLGVVPLLLFWGAYRLRADQKRTLLPRNTPIAVAFVDRGRKLAVIESSLNDLSLWDVASKKRIGGQNSNSRWYFDGQFFDGGNKMVRFEGEAGMNVLDVQNARSLHILDWKAKLESGLAKYEDLSAGYLSNDGNILAIETWTPPNTDNLPFGSKVRLWNVKTQKKFGVIEDKTSVKRDISSIQTARFSPDDRILATGNSTGIVSLWDVDSGNLKHRLLGQKETVVALAFSPDGKTLASGSTAFLFSMAMDPTIKLWNVRTGALLHTLHNDMRGATALAFSPDGKTLASGDKAGDGALWNVATGQYLRALDGHDKRVTTIDFSPDGKMLATGSDDGKVKLWNLK